MLDTMLSYNFYKQLKEEYGAAFAASYFDLSWNYWLSVGYLPRRESSAYYLINHPNFGK